MHEYPAIEFIDIALTANSCMNRWVLKDAIL